MKIRKTISIILLLVFVFTLPASFLIGDLSRQASSQDRLTNLIMTSALSNEALPQRIREIIWFHHWYGGGLEFGPRYLLTGIRAEQWVELLGIILPEKERERIIGSLTGEIFSWLDNNDPYPKIEIDLNPVFVTIRSNLDKAALWIVNTFKVPPCKEDRLKEIEAGNYGDDLEALISCHTPENYREGVAAHLAPMILNKLDEANPPEKIDVTGKLRENVEESRIVAVKSRLNRLRKTLSLTWVLPVLIFALALAVVVRSLGELMAWAGWSLLAGGLLGGILTWRISNPLPLLDKALMPPPAGVKPQAIPVLKGVMAQLLNEASPMLAWQTGIVFLVGMGFLLRAYYGKFSKQSGNT